MKNEYYSKCNKKYEFWMCSGYGQNINYVNAPTKLN